MGLVHLAGNWSAVRKMKKSAMPDRPMGEGSGRSETVGEALQDMGICVREEGILSDFSNCV